jgi:hypothetical protein
MDFREKLSPQTHDALAEAGGGFSEQMTLRRLYVNSNKSEYLEVDSEIGSKIDELLRSQEDVIAGENIEALFSASDKIAGANCHKTALFLTGRYSKEELFAPHNDNPQTAGHDYVEAHSTLYPELEGFQAALASRKFPFRISFFKPKDGKNFAYHSITVLGLTNKNTIVGFEKEGPYADTPFKYINANDTITAYLMRGYTAGLESGNDVEHKRKRDLI